MEVTPVMMEVRPVIGVTVAVAITAAMVDAGRAKTASAINGRSAKAATVDRHPAAPEAATVERPAAAPETAAMERRAAAPESAAVKAAAAKTSSATATETTTAAATEASTAAATKTAATAAVLNFDRQPIGCMLRSRSRAWTCERQRLGALL
jgi:hypothetical protein